MVVSPGRTEPIEKYFEVVDTLTGRGFAVLVHDWRGQGLSHRLLGDRKLGHAHGFREYLDDYDAVLASFESRLPNPWIALGHSMGACLNLLALAEGENRFSAGLMSAPMLGIRLPVRPSLLPRALARGLTALGRGAGPATRSPSSIAFEDNIVTHDRARWLRNEALIAAWPDLMIGDPTWGWLDFALTAIDRLNTGRGVPAIDIPITMVIAGDERLVDNAGSRRVAARLRHSRLIEIPGALHEVLQETDALQAPFWLEFDRIADELMPRG